MGEPNAMVKKPLIGIDASIASAPKFTVIRAASVVVGKFSFDPDKLLMM